MSKDRIAWITIATSAVSALMGAALGAGLTNRTLHDEQVRQQRLEAYVELVTALSEYTNVQAGIARRWPESCLRMSLDGKLGGPECRISESEQQRLRDAVSRRYVAARRLDFVGTPAATAAAYKAQVASSHRYTASDPLLIAVGQSIARRELVQRNLIPGSPLDEDEAAMERVLACEINDHYYTYGGGSLGSMEACP